MTLSATQLVACFSLSLLAAGSVGCAAPVAAAPPAVAAPVVVVPGPPALPAPPSKEEGAPTVRANVRLVPVQSDVPLGSKLQLTFENVDDHAHRAFHPGGSSGCASFTWRVTLVDARGVAYGDMYEGPDRACTAVMVPPSTIEIAPGKQAGPTVDTGASWYASPSGDPMAKPVGRELLPGTYEVIVRGADLDLRTGIRVAPRRR